MIGTSRLFEANITYKYNDHDWVNGRAFSNGSYCEIGVSFKYPISNFWKKNKKQKRVELILLAFVSYFLNEKKFIHSKITQIPLQTTNFSRNY